MSAQTQAWITPEEYLEMERAAEFRHEYYNGRVYAMAGGSLTHAFIIDNVGIELRSALKHTACRSVTSEMRVRVTPDGLYAYPDILVYCGKPEFVDERTDTLVNPRLIIEVLSPSTEAYDRGFKSTQYRKLPSLQELALVSQSEAHIEIFSRQPTGGWSFSEVFGLEATCRFTSVNCDIALAGVYYEIEFSADPLAHRPAQ